jgi:hypothetical protein
MGICSSRVLSLMFAAVLTTVSTIAASAGTVNLFDDAFGSVTFEPGAAGFKPSGESAFASVCTNNCGTGSGNAIEGQFTNNPSPSGYTGTNKAGMGALDNALTWDPATQGPIISISASADKEVLISGGSYPSASPFRLLLEQGGNFYLAQSNTTYSPNGTFVSESLSGLTASSFTQICLVSCNAGDYANTSNLGGDSPVALNLVNGGDITFGVLLLSAPTEGQTVTAYQENLDVTLNTTPLPSTWTMLIAGFVGLGFFAYRGSKKNTATIAAA